MVEANDYPVDPKRWWMVVLLVLQQLIDTMMWLTFAPIALETSVFFDIPVKMVNGLSLLTLALFLPGMLWCSYLVTTRGMRFTVLMAAALHAVGAVLRWASLGLVTSSSELAFIVLLSGQALAAGASPICTNLPVRLAGDWFPQHERDVATTVANCGFGLGNVAGMLVPGFFISRRPEDGQVYGMGALLLFNVVFALAGFVWTWKSFADAPAEPPSQMAAKRREARNKVDQSDTARARAKLLDDYKGLLANRQFLLVLCAFATGLGLFNSLMTVLEQLLQAPGYDAKATGLIANALIIGGLPSSYVVARILDRTHEYNKVATICYVGTAAGTTALFMALRPGQLWTIVAAAAVMGMFALPLLPVSLELAAEVTYPLSEESSTGLLIFAGNSAGILLTVVYGIIIPMAPAYTGVWTPAACMTVSMVAGGALCSLFFKGAAKRHLADTFSSDDEADFPVASPVVTMVRRVSSRGSGSPGRLQRSLSEAGPHSSQPENAQNIRSFSDLAHNPNELSEPLVSTRRGL